MDDEYKVEVCLDLDYVKSILFDDEMWERCADDFTHRDSYKIEHLGCVWLKCYYNDSPMGVVSLKSGENAVIDIHIHISKENRGKNTRGAALCALKWVKDNAIAEAYKLNTKIPVIYKDVIRFSHSLGFKDEGIDTGSIMKNGKLIDRICLGLAISEI